MVHGDENQNCLGLCVGADDPRRPISGLIT